MGTSTSFGGPRNSTPLIPSWLDSDERPSTSGASDESSRQSEDNVEISSVSAKSPQRFKTPRRLFNTWIKSGGSDTRSRNRAIARYITSSLGGSKNATQRMRASSIAAGRLAHFLVTANQIGFPRALRQINLEHLAGKSTHDVLRELIDYFCSECSTLDENIARSCLAEVFAEFEDEFNFAEDSTINLYQIQILIESFIARSIVIRIINDIGNKIISLTPETIAEEQLEENLYGYIQGNVNDACHNCGLNFASVKMSDINRITKLAYKATFDLLSSLE